MDPNKSVNIQNQNRCQPSTYRPIWNGLDNLRDDLCAQNLYEYQSQLPGCYQTDNFFRWCETQQQYSNLMTEPAQFYKPYRNACKVDVESVLRNAELTNKGEIYQLFTKPYVTMPYMGAGQSSLANKALESQIQQGFLTENKQACNPTSGVTINRFECLPAGLNPQRVEHIIEPWVRGGEATSDYVRRVAYQNACLNMQNNNIINRTQ